MPAKEIDLVEIALNEISNTNSERILAIVGGALIERRLAICLEHRLREGKTLEKMMKAGGTLGQFNDKLDMAYALRIIENDLRTVIEGIMEIRNRFAHDLEASLFKQDEALGKSVAKLTLHNGRKFYPSLTDAGDTKLPVEEIRDDHMRLFVNVKLCLFFLLRDDHVAGTATAMVKALRDFSEKDKKPPSSRGK